MKKHNAVIITLLAGYFLLGMSSPIDQDEASSNTAEDTPQKHVKHVGDYTKPHAGIELTFNQSKSVEAGESFELQLTLSTRSASDELQVSVRNDTGLQLNSANSYQFDTRQGMTHSILCEFTALQDGLYYVDVTASLNFDGKQQARSFTIPVTVGDPANFKSSAEEVNKKRGYRLDAEQGVISMPAMETTE